MATVRTVQNRPQNELIGAPRSSLMYTRSGSSSDKPRTQAAHRPATQAKIATHESRAQSFEYRVKESNKQYPKTTQDNGKPNRP